MNWSIDAHAGASSTVTRARRRHADGEPSGLVHGAGHHGLSLTGVHLDHGDLGCVSGECLAQRLPIDADEDDGARAGPCRAATSSSNRAPLASPPATHTTDPGANAPSAAAAACALVAFESST